MHAGDYDIVFNYDSVGWQEYEDRTGTVEVYQGPDKIGVNGTALPAQYLGAGWYVGGAANCDPGPNCGPFYTDDGATSGSTSSWFPQFIADDVRDGAYLDSSPTGLAVTSTNSDVVGRHVFALRTNDVPEYPPGLGFNGEPVTDYAGWFNSWRPDPADAPSDPDHPGWPATWSYFALGDSFQSGEGTFNYYGDTDTSLNRCHRSPRAYPQLFTDMQLFGDIDLQFWACSGATSWEAVDQFYPDPSGPPWNDPNRLDWKISSNVDRGIAPLDRLDNGVAVITIGMGGNDVGFEDVLSSCIKGVLSDAVGWTDYACGVEDENATTGAVSKLLQPYPSDDSDTNKLEFVIQELHDAAPNAQIYVFGYPRFFTPDGNDFGHLPFSDGQGCIGLRPSDQVWMNAEVRYLDAVVRKSAETRGAQYIDLYNVGAGRELCSDAPPSDWFMNPLLLSGLTPKKESFHPNVLGHQLIAQAFRGQAQEPLTGWFGSMINGDRASYPVTVGSNTPTLSTSIRYKGSDVELSLTSPSGTVYDSETVADGVRYGAGTTWRWLEVDDPEPGEWTIQVYGADLDPEGEPFHLQWNAEPAPNQWPVATATIVQHGTTVTVDGTGSTDADGTIVETAFDFGDGTVVYGDSAVHTYDGAGDVLVTMWVKDDQGDYGFAKVGATLAIPEYDFSGFTRDRWPRARADARRRGPARPLGLQPGQELGQRHPCRWLPDRPTGLLHDGRGAGRGDVGRRAPGLAPGVQLVVAPIRVDMEHRLALGRDVPGADVRLQRRQ